MIMVVSILYVILAILGLSFLIFIHELGHYYMARRLGMKVETFSIGFGRPIYSWERDGVKWQVGWLLFGGYVKIAGMDISDQKDLYDIQDGFFGKSPWDRIKVAFMGPFVNIVFALLAFSALWLAGGREKKFSEYTSKIGWIDPKSELYVKGVRPGDEITSYNGQVFQGSKDHLSAPMTSTSDIEIAGNYVNFMTKEKTPFRYTVKTYPHPSALEKDILTAGILNSANYVVYDRFSNGEENPLPEGSPMKYSGIEYGDRIVWIDGLPVYSLQQLSHILNDSKALVTIQRGQETLLRRIPRIRVEELKLDSEVREELIDWQFEAELNGTKIQKLFTIPYNLNNECVVEGFVKFIDKEKELEAFPSNPFSILETPLEVGDIILAIDGIQVSYSFEILSRLQQKRVNVIVERSKQPALVPSWKLADQLFDEEFNPNDLEKLVSQIGLTNEPKSIGNLYLLDPIVPKMRKNFDLNEESQVAFIAELEAQRKEIESIEDPEKRAHARLLLENRDNQLLLGLPAVKDKSVNYNPNPLVLFNKVFEEIWHTLKALFTGSLNPKWMSGPIGIVQVVHDHSMVSWKEAVFWLGAISLNLGFLNLLPLPVLDGGTICFALYELITGRRLKSKTIEKLIIPFAILLIGFFIFLTYHDLSRLLHTFFH
ncbi:putative zinc metalloprotease [Candidatus Protochlamydia amoebophila]|uniref:Putative zinc metalloprotease n=2 Tax=Candidatus Protochlamydia amoebophila TaxID=362787 RepID=A0A0C1JTV7_9BACT|nr:putative zinc metalloprotease [Candidatus Protochlamydia amoebophila]